MILERTPYGKGERSRSEIEPGMSQPMTRAEVATFFVRAGFVVIYQDCRGRYGSEGEFTKYLDRGAGRLRHLRVDRRAAVVQRQDRHHGPVLRGAHAGGARLPQPAGPRRMVLDFGGFSNAYQSGIRQGGAFELKQAHLGLQQRARKARRRRTIRS